MKNYISLYLSLIFLILAIYSYLIYDIQRNSPCSGFSEPTYIAISPLFVIFALVFLLRFIIDKLYNGDEK